MRVAPTRPFNVTVRGGDHPKNRCMKHWGEKAPFEITVPGAGMFCEDKIGYIETKRSSTHGDICATRKSFWSLNLDGGPGRQGAGLFRMHGELGPSNEMEVNKKSTGLFNLCKSKEPCTKKKMRWEKGDEDPIYVRYPSSSD